MGSGGRMDNVISQENHWVIIKNSSQKGKVIETYELWGTTILTVWVPASDAIVRLSPAEVEPTSQSRFFGDENMLRYVAAACRVRDTLSSQTLISPLNSSVIPLPHQLEVLRKAMHKDRLRLLLADEVGLGKTIEAGLVYKELKLRNLVKRVLVVAPKSLVTQWQEEMLLHFGEEFQVVSPSDFPIYRRVMRSENVWQAFDRVVCSLDSIKPIEGRKGWGEAEIEQHNRERTDDIFNAGWDLIIVDEAHRLGGSTSQVARYKLGKILSQASARLLFLSATPHQGKTESFFRIMRLLDKEKFTQLGTLSKEAVAEYVIRTYKRNAIDSRGASLFTRRMTRLITVEWSEAHERQKELYKAVTEYVRRGYNRAEKERKNYIGFLMILMQRLVTSSTRAITSVLEKRSTVLGAPEEQLNLFPSIVEEEWYELGGDEQAEALLTSRFKALQSEREEVKLLLDAARVVEEKHHDAKVEKLIDVIYQLQKEESDPELKILIFTEFVQTQAMLENYLTERGISVVLLNGSMNMAERIEVQKRFSKEVRVMISTDAGGEGLNLQFCHIVVNYDIPWNPMKLEQRIGRVDRIGQSKPVKAVNFMLSDTVEHRVRDVLEQKLSVIYEEYGVDKTEDVLDSQQAGSLFENMFIESIVKPDTIEEQVERTTSTIKTHLEELHERENLLSPLEKIGPETAKEILSHPFPSWVETMVKAYVTHWGGTMDNVQGRWNIRFPNGRIIENVSFHVPEKWEDDVEHLTVEHECVWPMVQQIPRYVEGEAIPVLEIDGIPEGVQGLWSLHKVSAGNNLEKYFALFTHDDGRILPPTALMIWDALLFGRFSLKDVLSGDQVHELFTSQAEKAVSQSEELFHSLLMSRNQDSDSLIPGFSTHLLVKVE
jgi:ERCC4-related helicase